MLLLHPNTQIGASINKNCVDNFHFLYLLNIDRWKLQLLAREMCQAFLSVLFGFGLVWLLSHTWQCLGNTLWFCAQGSIMLGFKEIYRCWRLNQIGFINASSLPSVLSLTPISLDRWHIYKKYAIKIYPIII